MKPFNYNHLNNFIAGWYIDNNICDAIVSKGEDNLLLFSAGIKEYTNCDLKNFDVILNDLYSNQLTKVLEEYKKIYPYCFKNLNTWKFTPPRIQRYDPGKSYSEIHCENNGQTLYQTRHLVYMTYLNDITNGGGTEFPYQNLTTPPEKGLTLVWPAGWTHQHRGIVSNKETKYIITGWCCFD